VDDPPTPLPPFRISESLFENSGAWLCRPRPAAASPQESASRGILATLRLVFD